MNEHRAPQITRGEFLRLIVGAATASSGAFRAVAVAAQAPDARGARTARVIQTYDSQGIHRTGTETDRLSAAWLRAEAESAGARAELEPFSLDRVDPVAARLEIDGRSIDGLPLFDGGFTDTDGIRGRLGVPGSQADVVLAPVDGPGISSEGRALEELRRGSPHRALVVVTNGAHPGLSPMNAASFTAPYGVPVLQIGSEHGTWLAERARAGAPIRFLAHATRTRVEAHNVVATVPGRGGSLPPVVVITPRSGWWQCAAERGGGIACWLEAIRAAAEARAARTAMFVASSGHELGHLGLDSFLHSRSALIKNAAAWVHLGANIGAAGGRPRLQASDDQIESMMASALERARATVQQRVPRGTVPAGEARNIHVGGGRYVSLLGSSPYFHSQADRWPAAVDAAAVGRFAGAVASLAAELLSLA